MKENKFKVVVTRAPRLKTEKWVDLPYGTYFLCGDGQIMSRAHGTSNVNVDASKRGFIELWSDVSMVYSFGPDFDEVAKWVANGRKPEDLQGDANYEYMTVHNLPKGMYAEVISFSGNTWVNPEEWEGSICLKAERHTPAFIRLHDGFRIDACYSSLMSSNMMVWPVRFDLGDKIEIVPA